MSISWDDPPNSRVFAVCGRNTSVRFIRLPFRPASPCHKPRYSGCVFSSRQAEFLRNVFLGYGAVQSVKYIREKGNWSCFMIHVCLVPVAASGLLSPAASAYDMLVPYHGPYMRGTGALAAQSVPHFDHRFSQPNHRAFRVGCIAGNSLALAPPLQVSHTSSTRGHPRRH